MMSLIYADNAATTQLDPDAYNAMKPFLLTEYGNASQPYSFARSAKKALKEARETIAQCIGANPDEIYFTSGGTESDNWAIKGSAFSREEKAFTITSAIEHHAVLRACADIERMGYPVLYLSADQEGVIQPESLQSYMTERPELVSVMLVNNEIGTIQKIRKLSDIAHDSGAIFHTDAVQAVGHINVNVDELGVDLLSASGHKFNGPKGIGFLYIRRGTPLCSYMSGGSQESGMRAGTENVASIVGMAVTLKKNCDELNQISVNLMEMERIILNILDENRIDYIRNGCKNRVPGNMSLSFREMSGETLLHRMDLLGICVSTGSACDGSNTQVSHVLKAIHLPEEYARGTIRISLGKNNTKEEAERIAKALVTIVKSIRTN